MPDQPAGQPQTIKGSDGVEYVFTPATPQDLASSGGLMHRVGQALYGAAPEIAGGAASLIPGVGLAAAPVVGAGVAAVQRRMEGADWGDTAKSAGVHGAMNALPAVGKIPAVGRAVGAVTDLGGMVRKIPGAGTLVDTIKTFLPKGVTGGAEAAMDIPAELAKAGGYAQASPMVQMAAQKAKLEAMAKAPIGLAPALEAQSRAAVLRTIDALNGKMAAMQTAKTGAGVTAGMRTSMPVMEMIKGLIYGDKD